MILDIAISERHCRSKGLLRAFHSLIEINLLTRDIYFILFILSDLQVKSDVVGVLYGNTTYASV